MEFVTRDWESGSGRRWDCIARDDEKLSTDSHLYKRAVSCKYYIAEWTDGLETYYSVTWPWRSCQDSGFGRDEIWTPTSRIRNGSAPLTTGRSLGVRVTADSALFVQFHEGRRHFAVHTVPFLELQLAHNLQPFTGWRHWKRVPVQCHGFRKWYCFLKVPALLPFDLV